MEKGIPYNGKQKRAAVMIFKKRKIDLKSKMVQKI
jgi:hypothetical protein